MKMRPCERTIVHRTTDLVAEGVARTEAVPWCKTHQQEMLTGLRCAIGWDEEIAALRAITHTIEWHDSGREPQCEPNPAYPDGIDVPSPRPAAKRIGSLASSSWQVPNSFGPGIRRSIVDQPFLYAALPPPLIPFNDLMPPVGGQHPFRCPLQIIGPVGGADGMIFAAKRVSAVSARSENVLLQARDISDVISLRPFKTGAASRPVD